MKSLSLKLDKFFEISNRKSTIKKEIIGGITTFLAMLYILSVNPGMLSLSPGAGDYQGAIFLGTALSSFIGTFLMGMFAKVPLALAPGMGLNAFFTFTVAGTFHLGYSGSLVAVFFSGILYFIIAITNLRKYLIDLLPKNFKVTIAILIGFFIGFIGLQNTGIITGSPETLTKVGDLSNPLVIIGIITFLVILGLHLLKINLSVIIGMLVGVVLLAIALGASVNSQEAWAKGLKEAFSLNSYNDFDATGKAMKEMWSGFGDVFKNPLFYIAIFTFLFVDFFDTTGTLLIFENMFNKDGVKVESGKKQNSGWINKANIVDGISTIAGSLLLNSSVTTYVESSMGYKVGARTGLASVTSSLLFVLSIGLWPILKPFLPIGMEGGRSLQPITGPVLIMVSMLILQELKVFDFSKKFDLPVLLIGIFLGTLGFSISIGFAFAALTHLFVYGVISPLYQILVKKEKDRAIILSSWKENLSVMMLIICILSIVYLGLDTAIAKGAF
ncbi:NCS2 family permease [Candidatus Mycoplasma pogonae]